MKRTYKILAAFLGIVGIIITGISFLILNSLPLDALGLACLILALTSALIPEELSGSGIMKVLFESALINTEKILEESGLSKNKISEVSLKDGQSGMNLSDLEANSNSENRSNFRSKVVYLPPSENGLISAYVPFDQDFASENLVRQDQNPGSPLDGGKGLRIFPIGAALGRAQELRGTSLENALNFVLIQSAEICSSIRVSELESIVIVEFSNIKIITEGKEYSETLGSIPSSLAACVIATVRNQKVRILDEETAERRIVTRFQVG